MRRSSLSDKRAANCSGSTAIEYGLVLSLIALAVLATIQLLGANVLSELYEQIVAAWG